MSQEPIALGEKAREILQAAVVEGLGQGQINRIQHNNRLSLLVRGEPFKDLEPGQESAVWNAAFWELEHAGLVNSADNLRGEVFEVNALGYKVAEEHKQAATSAPESSDVLQAVAVVTARTHDETVYLTAKFEALQRSHEKLVRLVLQAPRDADEFIGDFRAELVDARPEGLK